MAVAGENVLLLAGRLAYWMDAPRLLPLLEALSRFGVQAELLCLANEGVLGTGRAEVFECPGLASRWQRRSSARRLRRAGVVRRPQLLHALQTEMSAAARLLADRWRVPYLQTIDDFVQVGGRVRVSSKWCRGLVAPSQALADDLVGSLGVPEGMITVVPASLAVAQPVGDRPGGGQVPVVGAACPLVPGSGLAVFLDAAKLVLEAGLDVEFIVAGQGAGESDLRRRAERLRITERVTFVGALPAEGALWQVLDVFCQTSLVPTVGRPLAHALARGIPAITSDVLGIQEWTEGRADWLAGEPCPVRLIPPGDAEALSTAIQEAVRDVAPTGGRRSNGLPGADERLGPEREARVLTALYRRVLEGAAMADLMRTPASSASSLGSERSGLPGQVP